MQGTRTIIDNVDETTAVIPIISDYEGPTECYASITKEEGFFGLYKGFGALILQYALHYSILKLTKYLIVKIGTNNKHHKEN